MKNNMEKRHRAEEYNPQSPLIIGIGASAGGLEALQQFFDYMPPNSGLSFVVIQHLSPDYKSLMADILGKHTEMSVCQAEDGMGVEADTVYLIPPKKYLTLQGDRLLLSDAPGTLNHPIDAFFTSLAEERRDLAVRVYDSVSGSLGTGMMVLQLAEDIRSGMDWQTLTERRAPWLIAHTFPFFSVDTLEYLQKGGRIGKVTAMAGTMLQIKPIITFAADGQLQSIAKVRGRNLVIRKLIELVTKSHSGATRYNLAVANGGAPKEMEVLRSRLMAALPDYDHIWEGEIDGTLSVYIGDGVLGAAVQPLD